MLQQLPAIAIPSWLANLSADSVINDQFPLRDLLRDSLYYPSSGFDGDPVKHLAGNVLSFIYVDYSYMRDEFKIALEDSGFRGYDVLASRWITERELTPNGWRATLPSRSEDDPSRYRHRVRESFCSWSVLQRRADVAASHGPFRVSLVYLCADGVAAYQALYVANNAAPLAVAVIQPGYAFGGNWTDYTDPQRIFARTVLENPSGQPEILLYGGIGKRNHFREPCWPEYQIPVFFLGKGSHGNIGVWSKTSGRSLDIQRAGRRSA